METKQHNSEQPTNQKKYQQQNQKASQNKWKHKNNLSKPIGDFKISSDGEIYSTKSCIKKSGILEGNNLILPSRN